MFIFSGLTKINTNSFCTKLKHDNLFFESKKLYPILKYQPNDTIYIVGINQVNEKVLLESEEILKKFYRFQTFIVKEHMNIGDKYYKYDDTTLVYCEELLKDIKTNSRILLVTDKELRALDMYVMGLTLVEKRVSIVTTDININKTIIHEIGHTYGLSHCEDKTCVMTVYDEDSDSGSFCDKCKNLFGYY